MQRLEAVAARSGVPMLAYDCADRVPVADAMRLADDCGANYSDVF